MSDPAELDKQAVLDEAHRNARANAIYTWAWVKVAKMKELYAKNGLKPGEYVQQLPVFDRDTDFEFFKEGGKFDECVFGMDHAEFKVYLHVIEMLLNSEGYEVKRVPINQMKFLDYVNLQESNHGGL